MLYYAERMLPSGHIAAGLLLGLKRRRASTLPPGVVLGGAVAAAVLPDLDLLLPTLLDRLGIEHRLESGRHHSWATHTPAFWGAVAAGAHRLAHSPWAPGWAPQAASLVALGTGAGMAALGHGHHLGRVVDADVAVGEQSEQRGRAARAHPPFARA